MLPNNAVAVLIMWWHREETPICDQRWLPKHAEADNAVCIACTAAERQQTHVHNPEQGQAAALLAAPYVPFNACKLNYHA